MMRTIGKRLVVEAQDDASEKHRIAAKRRQLRETHANNRFLILQEPCSSASFRAEAKDENVCAQPHSLSEIIKIDRCFHTKDDEAFDLHCRKSSSDTHNSMSFEDDVSQEMAPRGKNIVSLATDFDFKLQKIQRTYHDMQLDLKEARQFLRDHIAAVAAAYPAALPNAFAPMLPHTPTALRC